MHSLIKCGCIVDKAIISLVLRGYLHECGFDFKIAAIGILVSILNVVLTKSGREEMAMMTTLAAVVVVLLMVAKEIVKLFDTVKALFGF